MKQFCDVLWSALHPSGISWIGFYEKAVGDEMVLVSCRDKPACSPIGMHGACGRAFLTRKPLVVRDVKDLGENYIACDPRDRSEIVIPLFNNDRDCWGVLDADSYEVGAFSEHDVSGMTMLLLRAGLTINQ